MSSQPSIVVLGGGYAGVLAANRLARDGQNATLVNASDRFCERIRLHQLGAGQALARIPITELLGANAARWQLGWVDEIDLASRRLHLRGGVSLAFDTLVLATGSEGDRADVPGAVEHAWGIAELHDATRLAEEIAGLAEGRARLLVVGGGLTGIELAIELASAHPGLQVLLASAGDPARSFSAGAQRHLRRKLATLRVEVIANVRVTELSADHARLAGGGRIPFEACVWAGSVRALSEGREAGLQVDESGRALLDDRLRSRSHPFVSVVGDAGIVFKTAERASAASCQLAMSMGAYVADRLSREARGLTVEPFRFRAPIRCVSLGRNDGIVQGLRADESPARLAVVGHLAAKIKEGICNMTVRALAAESAGTRYKWLKGSMATPTNSRRIAEEENRRARVRSGPVAT